MTIVITGASGMTGQNVMSSLRILGARVRAVSSNELSATRLQALGADETAVANFSDELALARAFEGADTVFHIPPRMHPDETDNGLRVIRAAKSAGVRVIALHSVINSQVQAIRFHVHKRLVEEAAITCGMPWVIFQPTNYMQNVDWQWSRLLEHGELLMPYPADVRISWLDLHDYAEAVAHVLTTAGYEYGVYEMASARSPLTRHQMAATWSQVLGRAVRATAMPLEAYMALPHWRGRDPREMAILRTMFEEFGRHGAPGGNWHVLASLLGREPTQYDAFARRHALERNAIDPHDR
uniref:NmrA family NAD(P)-binding protein n=1 Tax=Limnohabitans sp. TaxID=1907725 RepID=UPI0040482281